MGDCLDKTFFDRTCGGLSFGPLVRGRRVLLPRSRKCQRGKNEPLPDPPSALLHRCAHASFHYIHLGRNRFLLLLFIRARTSRHADVFFYSISGRTSAFLYEHFGKPAVSCILYVWRSRPRIIKS